ncbi:pseudouridylate synthase RPUSD2-like [Daktulosphaira vitifoliae]|uniref:pseudouridylate synthase RPUSD2-like n=1 Tax=Daktulosphaira vitifoliae TaxID=58002 RepID=UPI0021AA75F0|nr:pseudouridylate synthase RPUSD2-like [Daktulosphaira vitifoliae]
MIYNLEKFFKIIICSISLKEMKKHFVQLSAPSLNNKVDINIQCSLSDSQISSDSAPEFEESTSKSKRKIFKAIDGNNGKHKKAKLEGKNVLSNIYNETSYYFENGLRKVYPYYYTFTTHTKGRWVGRTLLEVFGKEFRAHSTEEYEHHIQKGSLTINNEQVTPDYVLQHNDLLSNTVHRHEVPVTKDPIDIIYLDKNIVVVNKPASIPVHPCGRYRHNTVIFLLAKEHNLKNLKTIHRLDRLTSGILLFGRTQSMAQKLEEQIRNREVKKQYICIVEGKFPESIECSEPIEVVSYKIGVCKVSSKGKICSTKFKLIDYNETSNTSLVKCYPNSGRMHQIRVHLQYLGHPITNDPLYNDVIFGPEKGRGGNFNKSDEKLIEELIKAHNAENWSNTDEKITSELASNNKDTSKVNTKLLNYDVGKHTHTIYTQTEYDPPDSIFDHSKLSIDPYCKECQTNYRDPKPENLIMYLHAYKYSGPGWEYKTQMPNWANLNWKEHC